MPNTNIELIERFYRAFGNVDADAMAACYAPDVRFEDPAFGVLFGREAGDMWRMLLHRARDFALSVDGIEALGQTANATAVVRYTYSATGRPVVNEIRTRFTIRDGLIFEQTDAFDLWRWSRQALGPAGWCFGWTPRMQQAIRRKARRALADYRKEVSA